MSARSIRSRATFARRSLLTLLASAVALLAALAVTSPAGAAPPQSTPWIHTTVPAHLGFQLYWWDGFTAERDASVTGYDVQYRQVGATHWRSHPHAGTVRAVEIANLATGTAYEARVRATNADGAGPWSEVQHVSSVVASPGQVNPPFPFLVAAGDGRASVVWGPPSHTGGRTLTGYVVRLFDDASTQLRTIPIRDATATSASITGLTNGADYTVDLYATYGESDDGGFATPRPSFTPSASLAAALSTVRLEVSPDTVPGDPSATIITEGESVTVSVVLSLPLPRAVTIPVRFDLEGVAERGDLAGALPDGLTVDAGSTRSSVTIATNHDDGAHDERFSVAIPQNPPLPVGVLRGWPTALRVFITDDDKTDGPHLFVQEGDGRLRLSWEAPAGAVDGYDVEYKRAAAPETAWRPFRTRIVHIGSGRHQVVWGLENGAAYDVRVRAVSARGPSRWSPGAGTPAPKPNVFLSAPPGVPEGSRVTVTVLLSEPLPRSVTIPLAITDETAEPGDRGALGSITIRAGETEAEGTITTAHDADADHETFTVAVATDARLPASVYAGDSSWARVVIEDLDAPTVALSAPPPPGYPYARSRAEVAEGESVIITATLSRALRTTVTIPLEYRDDTAEEGDYEPLPGIVIAAGETSGRGTLRTNVDADPDDETVFVVLGRLLPSLRRGSPEAVYVTIRDGGAPADPGGQSAQPERRQATGQPATEQPATGRAAKRVERPDSGLSEAAARYDANNNGRIDAPEYWQAITDYNAGRISYEVALEITLAAFRR